MLKSYLSGILFLVAFSILGSSDSFSQQNKIMCKCNFDNKTGFSAYGSRFACSAYTNVDEQKDQYSCEIAFGAYSNSDKSADTRRQFEEYQLTQENLTAIEKGDFNLLSDPNFLTRAIPAYMRAAYLRDGVKLPGEISSEELNRQIIGFSEKNAEEIGQVFAGKRDAFDFVWGENGHVYVQKGAVRFVYKERVIISTVFF